MDFQANLRSAAYEALMEMIKNSPKDCYITVQKTTMSIMERLQQVEWPVFVEKKSGRICTKTGHSGFQQVIAMESRIQSQSDRVQYNDLQSLLCATLQSVLRKVEKEHAPQISDHIMTALLQMFQVCKTESRNHLRKTKFENVFRFSSSSRP